MNDQVETQSTDLIDIAADLVAAYVSNNRVSLTELPGVIASVHATLSDLGKEKTTEPVAEKLTPAQVKKSISPDALISFIDGKRYKTLKRHLTKHGLTMERYRARYGLPSDYPATSADYSARRSELARTIGLGQLRKAASKASETDEAISEAPKPRGRPRNAAEGSEEGAEAAPKARSRKKVAETVDFR